MSHQLKVKIIFFTYDSQTSKSLKVAIENLFLTNISDFRTSIRNLTQYLIQRIEKLVLNFKKKKEIILKLKEVIQFLEDEEKSRTFEESSSSLKILLEEVIKGSIPNI